MPIVPDFGEATIIHHIRQLPPYLALSGSNGKAQSLNPSCWICRQRKPHSVE